MVTLAPRFHLVFAAQLCPYDLLRHKSSLHMHSCMLVWHLSSESSPAIQSSNPVQWSSPQSSPAIRDGPMHVQCATLNRLSASVPPKMMWLLTELLTWSNSSFYNKIHCWSYGSIMYQPSHSQSSCRLPDSCRPLASPEHTFQEFVTGRKQCWALQVTGHKVTLSIWSKVLKITCTDK